MPNRTETLKAFERLLDIMDELREKCPWDREQTLESIRNLTIEEAHELADAILSKDMELIRKELGDLMLHIVFYAKIASEQGSFGITDVLDGICEKLIFRHPHVFGEVRVSSSSQVVENWEQLKMRERGGEGKETVLSGVPRSLPSLVKANRIQEKVKAVGFDWNEPSQVWDKLAEEINELKHEAAVGDKGRVEAEFGDVLFSVVNAARLYGVDPETALERTNRKFIKRFNYLENKTITQGRSLKSMSLDEMNIYWEQAKEFDG